MSFSNTTQTELKDHVAIGEEKKLFCRSDASPGSIFWLPDGTRMYKTLVDYLELSLKKQNYLSVKTPFIYKKEMWEQTGHWDKYKDNMFMINGGVSETEDTESTYGLKPMNCPGHAIIYDKCVQSERDLPFRLMEFGVVHRNEPSNSLRGLFRLRQFTQDDAHIFCTMKQSEDEINNIIIFIKELYSHFDFKYSAKLSTRPTEFIGENDAWDLAEETLKKCIVNLDKDFTVDEGDGAFYGPKIDITITDSRGRDWQCGTIQLDLNMNKTMNLSYAMLGEENHGKSTGPVVIHRAVLGSVERFIGILLEHTQGKLPFWLDSKQIYIAPVKETCDKETYDYIKYLTQTFSNYNINLDLSNNSFPKKIKNAEMEGYHYIFIVGPNEVKNLTLSYRNKGGKKNGQKVKDVYNLIEKKEYAFM
jgi:threonyl-tRNA synthetase